jgi:large subunit ribosomal protein L18e
MMKGTITRPRTLELLNTLRKAAGKNKAGIWLDLAERLRKPVRTKKPVNLSKLNRLYAGKILVVPSKVLAEGLLEKKIEVAAFSFSGKAREKIKGKNGVAYSIEELIEKNPKGSNLVIIG